MISPMRRTQIYLDEDQKKALKALALDRDATVSDLVREAVARLLRDEVTNDASWQSLGRLQQRIRTSVMGALGHEPTDDEIAAAAKSARKAVARKRGLA